MKEMKLSAEKVNFGTFTMGDDFYATKQKMDKIARSIGVAYSFGTEHIYFSSIQPEKGVPTESIINALGASPIN